MISFAAKSSTLFFFASALSVASAAGGAANVSSYFCVGTKLENRFVYWERGLRTGLSGWFSMPEPPLYSVTACFVYEYERHLVEISPRSVRSSQIELANPDPPIG